MTNDGPGQSTIDNRHSSLLRRLRHYANAVWAENIKEWKLELTYPLDFLRSLIDPVVYLLPYVLYGLSLIHI